MTIEEIRYDFTEYVEHYRSFFSKTLRLIIISKLNCQETNKTSIKYFNEIVNNIEGCRTHRVKYGKPMIFTKFLHYEFTYQTIKVTMKITDKYIVDILLESIIPDFVRFFDELSSDAKTIKWNTASSIHNNNRLHEDITVKHEISTINSTAKGQKESEVGDKDEIIIQNEIKIIFYLLELLIETLYYLATISPSGNNDSLIGKTIVIKDVSVIKKNINIEILIDEKMVIIKLASKKNKPISVVLDTEDRIGNTIKQIILQNKNF